MPNGDYSLNTTFYQELGHNLRAGVTVAWEAFKTYFTIIGALVAALAILYSDAGQKIDPGVRRLLQASIALIGGVVSVLGAFGIRRILLYQARFLSLAADLEEAARPSAEPANVKREKTAHTASPYALAGEVWTGKRRAAGASGNEFELRWTGSIGLSLGVLVLFVLPFTLLTVAPFLTDEPPNGHTSCSLEVTRAGDRIAVNIRTAKIEACNEIGGAITAAVSALP